MKDKIVDSIGRIDDDMIESVQVLREKKRTKTIRVRWAAAAACLCAVLIAAAAVPKSGLFSKEKPSGLTEEEGNPQWDEKSEEHKSLSENASQPSVKQEAPPSGGEVHIPAESIAIGPLHLGMPRDEVESILGSPDNISNTGEVEIYDGIWMVSWWYGQDNAEQLGFINVGSGWILNEVIVRGSSTWELGDIRIGSPEETVLLQYPDAKAEEEIMTEDGTTEQNHYYSVSRTDGIPLLIRGSNGTVDVIAAGPFIQDIWTDLDGQDAPEPPWSFSSDSVTVFRSDSRTWRRTEVSGKAAKMIETIMGIEDLVSTERGNQDPVIWLDFHNGTVAALFGEDESGVIYRAAEGVSVSAGAVENGTVPDGLEEMERCLFPVGTWETVNTVCDES